MHSGKFPKINKLAGLNRAVQVGIYKICCMIIWEVRVPQQETSLKIELQVKSFTYR